MHCPTRREDARGQVRRPLAHPQEDPRPAITHEHQILAYPLILTGPALISRAKDRPVRCSSQHHWMRQIDLISSLGCQPYRY
jgi:hypothetical protein